MTNHDALSTADDPVRSPDAPDHEDTDAGMTGEAADRIRAARAEQADSLENAEPDPAPADPDAPPPGDDEPDPADPQPA